MIPRIAGGWQTTMADLALILFIVSVAGLQTARAGKDGTDDNADNAEHAPPAQAEPLALYRAGEGAPPLGDWLAEQAPDPRQNLTIVATYRPGDAEGAARQAIALARQADARQQPARIVLEPGETARVTASLAYDQPSAEMARNLLIQQ